MRNVPSWLSRREIRSHVTPFSFLNLNCGIKTYNLRRIIPEDALEDVFLGFSVDGCFLISFKADLKHYIIRFWLFPPFKINEKTLRLTLFAQTRFARMSYLSCLQESPGVRFIQSHLDPSTFVFLSCNTDGTGLVSAFGCMPDLDCSLCIENSLRLSNYNAFKDSLCTIHSQVLLINLDVPSIRGDARTYDTLFDNDSNHHSVDKSFCTYQHSISTCVPPCLRIVGSGIPNYSSNVGEFSSSELDCSCFASTDSPIGRIQIGICADTGLLRVAWASPDGQIKVICCSFQKHDTSSNTSKSPCLFPQGSFSVNEKSSPLLAYLPHLLTHNYCSTCYSWPEESKSCCSFTPSTSPSPIVDHSTCIFSMDPPCVISVSDTLGWPENHSSSTVRAPQFIQHNCGEKSTNSSNWFAENGTGKVKVWIPSLLFNRPSILSCRPVNYLAMLQDIRASYIHWVLISRLASSQLSLQCSESLPYTPPVPAVDSRDDNGFEWIDPNSSISSRSSSDWEQIALMSSPASLDFTISPEDLLAHRLSGQCHTSFDLSSWQELGDSNIGSINKSHVCLIAHLEEVVFDIPINTVQENGYSRLSHISPALSIFIPSEEPDLLLVYQHLAEVESPLKNSIEIQWKTKLIKLINLTTGDQSIVPDCRNSNDPIPNTIPHTQITLDRLKKITSYCPQNTSEYYPHKSHLHELNNFHMAFRLESLKLLVDPQGGYAVCW